MSESNDGPSGREQVQTTYNESMDDVTVKTSNKSRSGNEYNRPPMRIKPRRLISFKHGGGDDAIGLDPDEDDELETNEANPMELKVDSTEGIMAVDADMPTEFEQHLFQSRKRKALPMHHPGDQVRRPRRCQVTAASPGPEENVLICDSAAEQCVVGQGFKILFHTGQHVVMDGAMAGMGGGRYPIVCAAAVVEDETRMDPVIIILNQAAYNQDLQQRESLLHTEQARLHGVKINDLAACLRDGHGFSGKQSIETEGVTIPLIYDGFKYFVKVRAPSDKELEELPAYELTSPMPWEPQQQLATLRRNKRRDDEPTETELRS